MSKETEENISETPEQVDDEKIKPFDTLVLSGGGTHGFTMLGALQTLEDSGHLANVSTFVGTSIGAIISYMLAIGYKPIEIVVTVYTNKWLDKMTDLNLVSLVNGVGATSFTILHEALEKLTLAKIGRLLTLKKLSEDFGKTLVCTSYNMTTCKTEYLGPDSHPDLPCLTALRMTANIPLVFDRFRYMDNFYIDGGLSDNFPIDEGERYGERVLGIYLEISEKTLQDVPSDGLLAYFFRLLQVPIIQTTRYRAEKASEKSFIIGINAINNEMNDLHVPNPVNFNIDSRTRLELFSHGYSQCKRILSERNLDNLKNNVVNK